MKFSVNTVICIFLSQLLLACSAVSPPAALLKADITDGGGQRSDYVIGAGDELQVFVWGSPELSVSIPVKPDGTITTPLVEDVVASGKTSTQLARDVEVRLQQYVKSPVVTVTVTQFVGRYSEQIRVIGAATRPVALPYRQNMTLLDVLIAVGGISEFASGNRSSVVRKNAVGVDKIRVRLDDMLNGGDMSQNMLMQPGDILVIPESLF
ncbi:FIG123464: Polysaccharide export protein [hydrothermal vent metagenome]|uniref:FIG123464: Polysaccharide export protein n=1 Tax=hydrothermal vent metagenome TaxID=652676 RepID=A0A3B1A9U1_9ZZZZ